MMKRFFGFTARFSQLFNFGEKFFILTLSRGLFSLPGKTISAVRYVIWPKESKRRYRTVIFAVFLFAFLAANLDHPKYWNGFADWVNPKLGAVDMPEAVRRLDKWYFLKTVDEALRMPHFADIPFSRGLDLEGGIHLIYRADLSQVNPRDHDEAMGGLRDVIERRVNLFGVREPQVFVQKARGEYRLVVELAGITDFNKAIELIGQTPFLEFKELRPQEEQKRIFRKFLSGQKIQVETEGGENIDVSSQITEEQLSASCARPTADLILAVSENTGEDPCFKSTSPALTGKYLDSASLAFDQNTNQPIISLNLDETGAKIFEDSTARNIGNPLAIYLDGVLISAPTVQDKISGGRAQVTGFDIEGAKVLARNLNAGALPVPISLLSQQSIGASLGEESLQKSLTAGMVGLIAAVLFIAVVYKISGLLGVAALGVYLVLLLAIFKIIPVTLTLPGIAGLLLSIGMAVDANILVFERLREEFQEQGGGGDGQTRPREGQEFLLTLNRAYSRAWPSIRDGNVSTLLTCLILFWFSTSFVKGFALTLGIGVAVSMFSAMVVTKYLMRLAGEGRLGRRVDIWIR